MQMEGAELQKARKREQTFQPGENKTGSYNPMNLIMHLIQQGDCDLAGAAGSPELSEFAVDGSVEATEPPDDATPRGKEISAEEMS